MPISIIDGFKVTSAKPADLKSVWASTASLYLTPISPNGFISSSWRYEGMSVYCQDSHAEYRLIGGVADANWKMIQTGSNAISSSYSISASYSQTASFSLNGGGSGTLLETGSTYPITSSWANNTLTSSYSFTALNSITADFAYLAQESVSSSYALTASYALNGGSSISNDTASYISSSATFDYQIYDLTSSFSVSSSYSTNSELSQNTTQSIYAISASWVSASVKITMADTASYITGGPFNISAVPPSASADVATKGYVESLFSGISEFYLSATASGVGTDYIFKTTGSNPATLTLSTSSQGNNVYPFVWITSPNIPGITILPHGLYNVYHTCRKVENTNLVMVSPEIYLADASGNEYYELNATTTPLELTTTFQIMSQDLVVDNSLTMSVTDRLVLKLKISNTGTNTIESQVEGSTLSHLGTPISNANFIVNVSTASLAINALTASYISSSSTFDIDKIYNLSASWAPTEISTNAIYATSASFASSSLTASYISSSATFDVGKLYILSASYAANTASLVIPQNLSVTILTASSQALIGPGADTPNVTFYVSASNTIGNIVEVDRYDAHEAFIINNSGSVIIGNSTTINVTNPEQLLIDTTGSNTINVIGAYGTTDSYIQLNIRNRTGSLSASSDIVATNDTGNETGNYVDLGINSSGYTLGFVGQKNDGYLYNTGSNFYIGNISPGKNLYLFAGGLTNTGSIKIDSNGNITGSKFVGTASYALVSPLGCVLALCSAFTPIGTGADVAEIPVPYSPRDGSSSINWNVRRINFRVQTAGISSEVNIEKSSDTGGFSATTVGTLTLASGSYETSNSSSLGTINSGDKIRFNVTTLGTAQNWTITTELGQ